MLLSIEKYRFNQIRPLNPLIDKLDACKMLSTKLRLSGDTWKPYQSTLVHQQYIVKTKSCISFVEDKIVTPGVKHMKIYVCFLSEQFDNVLFVTKYEKSSVMPSYMCTKPCSGLIISQSNKRTNGSRLYPISDTEHYQRMRLQNFDVN